MENTIVIIKKVCYIKAVNKFVKEDCYVMVIFQNLIGKKCSVLQGLFVLYLFWNISYNNFSKKELFFCYIVLRFFRSLFIFKGGSFYGIYL